MNMWGRRRINYSFGFVYTVTSRSVAPARRRLWFPVETRSRPLAADDCLRTSSNAGSENQDTS